MYTYIYIIYTKTSCTIKECISLSMILEEFWTPLTSWWTHFADSLGVPAVRGEVSIIRSIF